MRAGARRDLEAPRRVHPRRMNLKVRLTILTVVLAALVGATAATAATTTPGPTPTADSGPTPTACKSVDTTRDGRWQPHPTTTPWQWQLQGKIDTSVPACVYDVDDFETSKATVGQLHSEGAKVICYVDAGSWEEHRPDAGQFPKSSLGERYEGWPEERWLDIAHFHKFAPIMEARFQQCAEKGFDAVEPDNIAGFENKTGFPLTRADQRRYNLWIARQVHERGMAVALKNDPTQAGGLVGHFDFAIVEECFKYHECGFFKPFIEAGKAVYEAEYQLPPKQFCARARALDFSAVRKGLELFDKPWKPCGSLPSEG